MKTVLTPEEMQKINNSMPSEAKYGEVFAEISKTSFKQAYKEVADMLPHFTNDEANLAETIESECKSPSPPKTINIGSKQRKEVVAFIQECEKEDPEWHIYIHVRKNKWQAKLKEWGLGSQK